LNNIVIIHCSVIQKELKRILQFWKLYLFWITFRDVFSTFCYCHVMFFMLCEIVLPDVLCFLYPILCNKERKMHVTSFIFIYCVCINWSVFAGAVGDGGSWFKFLSLLAKAMCNNNQLSFALKHWCSCDCCAYITLAVYQQSSWLYIYQIFRSIRQACFSLLRLQPKMWILWCMWQGFP